MIPDWCLALLCDHNLQMNKEIFFIKHILGEKELDAVTQMLLKNLEFSFQTSVSQQLQLSITSLESREPSTLWRISTHPHHLEIVTLGGRGVHGLPPTSKPSGMPSLQITKNSLARSRIAVAGTMLEWQRVPSTES